VRVAIACEQFDPYGGGLERWTWQLVDGLVRRGHEVQVVCFKVGAVDDPGPVRIHAIPWSASRLTRAAAARQALEILHADVTHDLGVAGRADIVHPQAGSGRANRQRDWLTRSAGDRWRRRLRPSYWVWLREISTFERQQYANAGMRFIAVSRAIAGDLERLHGVPSDRIHVIPNGIDPDQFSPALRPRCREATRTRLGAGPDATLFLFAAKNFRLKGLRPLLHALARVRMKHQNARLVVIGADPAEADRSLVKQLGLESTIRFEGFALDPRAYYAAADAFVLPTYYDACSLTVLEASACGIPAITTAWNGASELIQHAHDGFVIPEPDAIADLARAMTLCLDAALRCAMSPAARALGVRNSIHRNVEAIEALYHDVARQRR